MDAIGVERANVLGLVDGGLRRPAPRRRPSRAGAPPDPRRHQPGRPPGRARHPRRAAIDSDPDPSDAEILHELYPPDDQAEGRRFLRRLVTASQSGEIPDDFHVPARTTDAQVAAEDPWLRSDRNYRELAGIGAPTLAAAGREDPGVPPVNLQDRSSDPRPAADVPGSHAFPFSDRDAFTRAVEELVGR